MSDSTECAARVTSKVAHKGITFSVSGAVAGALAAGAIVVVGTGGALIVAGTAIAAASTGISVGKFIDKYLLAEDASEKIVKGVASVILEEERNQAANVSPSTRTDEHDEEPLTGSTSVFIENQPASRKGDLTKCEGVIVTGAPHIFYGGNFTTQGKTPGQVLPGWLETYETVLDWSGVAVGALNANTALEFGKVGLDAYMNTRPESGLKDAYDLTGATDLIPD